MRLRTFHAQDMNEAIQQVRVALGEEAIIIATNRQPGGKGVSVTAAAEVADHYVAPEAPVNTVPAQRETQALIVMEIEKILRFHNTPDYLLEHCVDTARGLDFDILGTREEAHEQDVQNALAQMLEHVFKFAPLSLENDGYRVMLIGSPGIGKTLTVAKMAAQLVMAKRKVIVVTTDYKRAGGIEQLSAFCSILGVDLKVANSRTELKAILDDCPPKSRVIIDSAGANPYDYKELKDLGEFAGLQEIEPVLVSAAGGDCDEATEATRAFSFLGVRKLILTRTDTAKRFGSILTSAYIGELAFANISSSSKVVGEFKKINANLLSQLLMQYRLES